MSRKMSTIGVPQTYGPRTSNEGLPNQIEQNGPERLLEIAVDYLQINAGIPLYNAEDDAAVLTLPKSALIKSAYFKVDADEAFDDTGNTAVLTIGVEGVDGSTVDADGIGTAAVATLTADAWLTLAGALIGDVADADLTQVVITAEGEDFTQGKGRLYITYIDPYKA